MSDRSRSIPSYRRHKQSGQAIVTLPDGTGGRRDVLLGRWQSPESHQEFARVIAAWQAAGRRLIDEPATTGDLSIHELLVAFLQHADQHYRHADGRPTSEVREYECTFRSLKALFGNTRAGDFSPLSLKAVRNRMIEDKLCRGVINQRIGRIKRVFKWAVGEALVPPSVFGALQCVAGLQRGRTAATESDPVKPVPDAYVEAIRRFVPTSVWGMIQLQRFTGMRPGEVVQIRACDIDMTGAVWIYRPPLHKMSYRGGERAIALGPQAQAVIRQFLPLDTQAYLFSPKRDAEERARGLRRRRQTPIQPSQLNRRKPDPKKQKGECFQRSSYARAIANGCRKADAHFRARAGKETKTAPAQPHSGRITAVPVWSPNQLRHNFATVVRKVHGLEAAQVALGHSRADVTQIYAERNLNLAVKVAAAVG